MNGFVKGMAIALLAMGLPICLMGSLQVLDPTTKPEDREGAIAATIFLGLPPVGLGSWLLGSGLVRGRRRERERLRQAFFRLVEEHQGMITVLRFAMETGLDGEASKLYLNERAQEFDGHYNVTDEGEIFYRFSLGAPGAILGSLATPIAAVDQDVNQGIAQSVTQSLALSSGQDEWLDVVLETCVAERKIETLKAIRELTGMGLKEAKDCLDSLPVAIARGVNPAIANRYQQVLAATGAEVSVVPSKR